MKLRKEQLRNTGNHQMKTFYEMTLLLKENLDVESKFTPSILASMNRKLKSMGYDVRGSQDVKNILKKGSVYRNGAFIVPDWETAYQCPNPKQSTTNVSFVWISSNRE